MTWRPRVESEWVMVGILFVGYVGRYFVTTHIYVLKGTSDAPQGRSLGGYEHRHHQQCPTFVTIAGMGRKDLVQADLGIPESTWDTNAAFSYLTFASTKLVWGGVTDRIGGRYVWCGSVLAAAGIAVGALATAQTPLWFLLAWNASWLSIVASWVALVKVASAWVPRHKQGRAMAILCLSYLAGDVVSRAAFGVVLELGVRAGALHPPSLAGPITPA